MGICETFASQRKQDLEKKRAGNCNVGSPDSLRPFGEEGSRVLMGLFARKLGELLGHLGKKRGEVREALSFHVDDRRRGLRDKAFVRELSLALLHFAHQAGCLLLEAFAFSLHVDFDLEHELEVAHDRDRRDRALRFLLETFNMFDRFDAGELLEVGSGRKAFGFVARNEERELLRG